ncbi:MAG: glycosyltransferase [Clostridia bacterium]|nr:glycosyltransferase [Clostridia bacterium]
MKLLFVLENLTARCGPTVGIALRLAQQLSARHEISVLTRQSAQRPIDGEKAAIFADVTAIGADSTDRLADYIRRVHWSRMPLWRRLLSLSVHPTMLYRLLDGKYRLCKAMRRPFQKALEQLCRAREFDAVVTFCAPYYLAQVLADANVGNAKKLMLQMDPYTYNYTLPPQHTEKRRALERYVAGRLDRLLAVSFVADEIKAREILPATDNLAPFELPGVDPTAHPAAACEPLSADPDRVHFVFTGQFYRGIRDPHFLLELFCRLPQQYVLHLVGGGEEQTVDAYRDRLGDRLVTHGWVSSEEAAALSAAADVLVNLNNTVSNQLASKLFEYMNTGKPLLNICKREDCLSLKYTAKYANCINVQESEAPEAAAAAVTDFVTARRGSTVGAEEILAAFFENTDAHLAKLLERETEKLL